MMLPTFLAGFGAGVLITLAQIQGYSGFGFLGSGILVFLGGYSHYRDING